MQMTDELTAGQRAADTARSIKRALTVLMVATAVLYLAVATVAAKTYHDANVNTDALCALRGDLERRVASSQQFLVKHPAGIPGIPVQTIRNGIVNQQRTINALSSLKC
jgi:hypothetical protein